MRGIMLNLRVRSIVRIALLHVERRSVGIGDIEGWIKLQFGTFFVICSLRYPLFPSHFFSPVPIHTHDVRTLI
jgi:hypothetical protein